MRKKKLSITSAVTWGNLMRLTPKRTTLSTEVPVPRVTGGLKLFYSTGLCEYLETGSVSS